jgi:hypothetical protein
MKNSIKTTWKKIGKDQSLKQFARAVVRNGTFKTMDGQTHPGSPLAAVAAGWLKAKGIKP